MPAPPLAPQATITRASPITTIAPNQRLRRTCQMFQVDRSFAAAVHFDIPLAPSTSAHGGRSVRPVSPRPGAVDDLNGHVSLKWHGPRRTFRAAPPTALHIEGTSRLS